jgi:hypothetical protein
VPPRAPSDVREDQGSGEWTYGTKFLRPGRENAFMIAGIAMQSLREGCHPISICNQLSNSSVLVRLIDRNTVLIVYLTVNANEDVGRAWIVRCG